MRFTPLSPLLLCVLLSSSCKDVTHVQMGYVSDRDDCASRAQYSVSSYTASSGGISPKERGVMYQQLFCECMKDHEWSVSGCKYKDKDVAKAPAPAPQAPTVVVVQAAPPAAAPVAAPAECPIPPKSKTKKRPKRKLDGTCPAPEEYSQQELDKVLNQP